MKALLLALILFSAHATTATVWLNPQDPGVDEVLNTEDNQMAFYNGPKGQAEWLLNRGRATAIRIKGYDDPAILKRDLSAYRGMTVLDAELHLTLYGSSTVNALAVSTINNDWFEGNQSGSAAVTDPLTAHASEFLKHWSHGLDGGLPYWDSYRTSWTTADTLAVLPSGDSVPGHGYFDGRIATIRMKGMRFAIQLCEYLNRVADFPGWNPSLVSGALSERYGDHAGMGYDAFGGDEYEGLDILSCHALHADLLKTPAMAKQRMKPDHSQLPLSPKKQ